MTLCEFIDDFVNNPNATQTGYLAQTQLFDQIPELRKGTNMYGANSGSPPLFTLILIVSY